MAIISLVALAFISARYIDKEEIFRVQTEMKALQQEKSANKNAIAQLEQQRVDKQLSVRRLNTKEQLENSFAQAYPQVVDAKNFGIVQISIDDEFNLKLPYYVIPAWFTETFVIEHNTMLIYKAEIETYKTNEDLYGSVKELKDTLLKKIA